MLQRTLVALGLLAGAALLLAFRPVLFPIVATLMGVWGQWEVCNAFRKGGYKPTIWTGILFVAVLYPVYHLGGLPWVVCLYLVLTAVNLVWGVFMPQRQLKDTMASIFAMFYPGLCLMAALVVNGQPGEMADVGVTLMILVPVANDIFAFLAGRAWGKTPLAPKVSPKKTWEGALGGFLAGILAAVGAGLVFRELGNTAMPLWQFAVMGLLCGLFGQVGDLTASTVKRSTGIKDFSRILGSHGGIMDRIDSILLGAVALFLFFTLFYGGGAV